MAFDYDGGKPGAGGTATLMVNGKKVGSGHIDRTEPNIFSADKTANVGVDQKTMVPK